MNKRTKLTKRPRHAVGSGYPRGEQVRSRILRVAIEVFGRHGFAGASTRAIAKAAGIKAPALQYYFGGKQRLCLACAKFIATTIGTRLS